VDGTEAAAGKNQLKTDLRIATAHEAKQFYFLFGVGSEIGVAAFGGADLITRAIPNEKSFAQAGARSEQRARCHRFLESQDSEPRNRPGSRYSMLWPPGAQIVQKNDVFDAEFRGKYGPASTVQGRLVARTRLLMTGPAIAETGRRRFFLTEMRGSYPGKFLGNEVEGGENPCCGSAA